MPIKLTGETNPDLNNERKKCTFNVEEMARWWYGGEQKLEEKRQRDNSPRVKLESLEHAKIDLDTISASGLSSGAFMTTMLHNIFSSIVKGAGIYAGGPFNVGYNVSSRDVAPVYAVNVALAVLGRSEKELQAQTISYAKQGLIDPTENLKGAKVYVYQGGLDTVNPAIAGLSKKTVAMYKYFGSHVKFLQLPFGAHGVPTDKFGSPCGVFPLLHDGLNNCGIESVFEMFSHFYGKNWIAPKSSSTPHTGTLYNFDQNPYTPSGNAETDFMNGYGGIYIPKKCENEMATCKLHVAFHGCFQTLYANFIDDVFAIHGGYLQAGDANDIIIVFPRTAALGIQFTTGKTNFGCWDWFGSTTKTNVPFKQMPQVKSVTNLLNAIIGKNLFA